MIRLENVSVDFDGFRLSGDLAVEAGAHLTLIGPSGGGKSSLLNLIAGFLAPESGVVRLAGRNMAGVPPAARPVTMLFQDHNLFPHLSVEANVGLGIDPSLRLKPGDRERVEAALANVGLGGLGARRPANLSGGQRQRVAIARALLRNRPILLLDEPFAALGPAQRVEMLEMVTALRRERGLTVVMVTHDPEEARRAGGSASVVVKGRFSSARLVDALLADPPPALAAYLG